MRQGNILNEAMAVSLATFLGEAIWLVIQIVARDPSSSRSPCSSGKGAALTSAKTDTPRFLRLSPANEPWGSLFNCRCYDSVLARRQAPLVQPALAPFRSVVRFPEALHEQ
jgi:hypothetical protein